jgi:hypothetical protein
VLRRRTRVVELDRRERMTGRLCEFVSTEFVADGAAGNKESPSRRVSCFATVDARKFFSILPAVLRRSFGAKAASVVIDAR